MNSRYIVAPPSQFRRKAEIVLNHLSRTGLVVGVWLALLALVIGGSAAVGATLTTSVVLLALGVAPVCVMLLIGLGAPPPTVAERLYAVDTNNGRS